MRLPISLLLVVFLLSCSSAKKEVRAELEWFSDWEEASTYAKRHEQPLFVEFSTEWCQYCKYMEERIFPLPEVAAKLQTFVRVRLDGDKAAIQPLMDTFHIQGFPTYLILTANGEEQKRFHSVGDAEEFQSILALADAALPGARELARAKAFADEDKMEEALTLYQKAHELSQGTKNAVLDEALWGLLEYEEEKEAIARYAHEYIRLFPDAPYFPRAYLKLAEVYSFSSLGREYMKKAATLLEERLAHLDTLPASVVRVTLDEFIEELADIYAQTWRHEKIPPLYGRAALALERQIESRGGFSNNRHLVGTIVYYYRKAGEHERSVAFLDRAVKTLPEYWPVYSSYARTFEEMGEYAKAAEAAEKAYALAEEVAKPKVALVWSEVLGGAKDFEKARAVLMKAQEELTASGAATSGRAKRLSAKLEERLKDFQLASVESTDAL